MYNGKRLLSDYSDSELSELSKESIARWWRMITAAEYGYKNKIIRHPNPPPLKNNNIICHQTPDHLQN